MSNSSMSQQHRKHPLTQAPPALPQTADQQISHQPISHEHQLSALNPATEADES